MAHRHHHPPLSGWWQQRQQHGNGGNKDVTAIIAMPVTAWWQQRYSMAVAEGIARRQRWRDIAAVAVARLWRYCSGGISVMAVLAQRWR